MLLHRSENVTGIVTNDQPAFDAVAGSSVIEAGGQARRLTLDPSAEESGHSITLASLHPYPTRTIGRARSIEA